MIKILIMLVLFGCAVLNIKSRFSKSLKVKNKTPKLSSLKGQSFSNYIDNITKDL